MPHYHFHVRDGTSLPDEEGTALADNATARHQGIQLMGRMLLDDPDNIPISAPWHLDVADRHGLVLFRLHFSAVQLEAA